MAAPEGNQYGLGNEGGRPALWDKPEHLQNAIDDYFKSCEGSIIPPEQDDDEPTITLSKPITITGLALYLGFESRQSLYDYEKREGFSCIIKKARTKVENAYEMNLYSRNPTGSIFALKNMGWKDTQEIKHDITKGFLNIDPLSDDPTDHRTQEDSKT